MLKVLVGLLLVICLVACGDDDGSPADAGGSDAVAEASVQADAGAPAKEAGSKEASAEDAGGTDAAAPKDGAAAD